ncbi:MAG: hypothetical protein WA996_03765 [Candidatus Promineifilaceae bacterium]
MTTVQPDSPAENAGLKHGYVINKVNGLTAMELLQEALPTPPLNAGTNGG